MNYFHALPRIVCRRAMTLAQVLLAGCIALATFDSYGQAKTDYALGSGDAIRIVVFQNPDLSIEARLSEKGFVTYPLIGAVELNGLSLSEAENRIATALETGGYLQKPQITISLTQVRNNQVSVLGQVARPGRFPLDTAGTRVSDMLASAGGTIPGGDDIAILTGFRNGQPYRQQIDIPALFLTGNVAADLVLQGGDTLYVHRAAVFYIYGEAQRSGAYRIERDMTVMQAIAQGGGTTSRGSEKRLRLHRRAADGRMQQLDASLTDPVLPNDVLFVKESLF